MAEIPQNMRFILFGLGPKVLARTAITMQFAGVATMILGIVSAATNNELCLGAGNWFLLTIILFFWGITDWFVAYFGTKEGYER